MTTVETMAAQEQERDRHRLGNVTANKEYMTYYIAFKNTTFKVWKKFTNLFCRPEEQSGLKF